LFAGSLTRNPITAVFCLTLALLLAGCSGSKSSDMGSYSGAVYTVKRGDTLYRISRMTGTSVKDIARMNNIPAPYTLEVGQQLRVNGSSSSSAKKSTTSKGKTAKVTPSMRYRSPPGHRSGSAAGSGSCQWQSGGAILIV
jgi:lipoprotein YgeR